MNRVSFVDKLMFTKHLSIMIKSGVPISEALSILELNTKSKYFKFVIHSVFLSVQNGKSLSESLKPFNSIFDDFYISLIKVSEQSGTLEETLLFLSEQLNKDYILRKTIQGAMFYPGIILAAGIGVGGFVSIYILPQLVDFFGALDIELPLPTKILLAIANLMKFHGIEIFSGFIIFLVIFRIIISTKQIKPFWHLFLLRMPALGKLIKYGQLSRMCRNLSTLMRSGVPIVEGLKTSSDTLSNVTYQRYLKIVRDDLIKGKSISISLSDRKFKEIPNMVASMIAVGEKTGNLEEVMDYLSEFYEDEVDDIARNLTTIIEPILLGGIGIMVGFIAIAIIGPIYKVTGNIR